MKRSTFFQRQLIVSLVGTIILVLGGFALSFYVMEARHAKQNSRPHPATFLANMIEALAKKIPPEEALKVMSNTPGPFERSNLLLLDEKGTIVASNGKEGDIKSYFPLDPAKLPQETGGIYSFGFAPTNPTAPIIVRLNTHPVRYLAALDKNRRGPNRGLPPELPMLVMFVLAAAILSATLSLAVLFYYLRKNSGVLEGVMEEIHSGNLKARVPVKKFDEVGQVMTKFNLMADEIEELVERVRAKEKMRINILQELGHDFRTPLASLSNALETLESSGELLSEDQKVEIASISIGEVNYLSRLVEDLLFLAQVDDPKYLKQGTMVSAEALIENAVSRFEVAHPRNTVKFGVENSLPSGFQFFADQHLVDRLLRNLFDNAAAHAKSRVVVACSLDSSKKNLILSVSDDGPGFDPEQLGSFGTKRVSRTLTVRMDQKISLGLGSVIIKAIVAAHQGVLEVENKLAPDASGAGANVKIIIPLRS